MSSALTFLFDIMAIGSAFLQASDNSLKNYISPALTAFCGLIILIGNAAGNVSLVGYRAFPHPKRPLS